MHKKGALEAHRTHFRARKISKFYGGVPTPRPLLHNLYYWPHFLYLSWAPPNPLSRPACHTRHNVALIELQVINIHIPLRPSSIDYLTVEQFIPSKLPNKP